MNNFITFDASLKLGKVGIGIYDNITKTSHNFITECENNSLLGEKIALGCAIMYAAKKNRKKVHLFTDNLGLAQSGIPPQFKSIVKDLELTLTWIPRELNKEADLASKNAFFPHIKNPSLNQLKQLSKVETKVFKKTKVKQTNIPVALPVFKNIKKQQKINMLNALATQKHEHEIIRLCTDGTKKHYNIGMSNSTINFIKIIRSVLCENELSWYANTRLKKIFLTKQIAVNNQVVSKESFIKFLKKRNYLNIINK